MLVQIQWWRKPNLLLKKNQRLLLQLMIDNKIMSLLLNINLAVYLVSAYFNFVWICGVD